MATTDPTDNPKNPRPPKATTVDQHSVDPIPNRLYKYVAPTRLDVLETGRIRVTQPEAFNDPFESLPVLSHLMTSSDELMNKLLGSLGRDIRGRIQTGIGTQIGFLSLAEDPLQILMWSHYASSHQGFVIEFDTSHQFFDQRNGDHDSFKSLRRIRYSDLRPSLTDGRSMEEMHYTKSTCWKYEAEWRLMLPLAECSTKCRPPGFTCDVCLFDYPREAITAITVGHWTPEHVVEAIRTLIRSEPTLRRVKGRLFRARPDDAEFAMRSDLLH